MDENIKLGRIFGVRVGLHWSWFLVFFLVTWSLSTGLFAEPLKTYPATVNWLVGGITSLLLFSSVLAHEFGHALVAIREGIGVRRITLFIFGGVAQIEEEPRTAGAEFRIALAGPLVSLALAALFGGIHWGIGRIPTLELAAAPARWLAQVNLTLVLFNMIPGFPLDGGRVLRSLIWGMTRSFRKATRAATLTGQLIAYGFMIFGIFSMSGGNFANGIWMVFIGWFLRNAAAASSAQQPAATPPAYDLRAHQVMDRRLTEIPADLPLSLLVEEKVVGAGQRSFLVSDGGQHPLGLVTLRNIIAIPRLEWSYTRVSQVMIPWERLARVSPNAGLASALEVMETARLAMAPVVENNRVEGLLTREQVLQHLRRRPDSGI